MRHLRLVLVIAGRGLREVSRMPGILAVIFVPGIVLYLIFTVIFVGGSGDKGGTTTPKVVVAVVDRDQSVPSTRLIESMRKMSMRVVTTDRQGAPLDDAGARRLVEIRRASAGLIIPEGFGAHPAPNDPKNPGVELVIDETQPMEGQVVAGMLQMAAGMTLMEMVADAVRALTGASPTPTSPDAGAAPDADKAGGGKDDSTGPEENRMLLKIRTSGVAVRKGRPVPPSSLLYLAGLVPMFLLFNCSGAASSMLEELQTGATRRVLVAPVSAADYLFGQMGLSMVICLLQCGSMYLFAWAVFKAPVFSYPLGLAILTVATACATVGFAMLMASVVRTAEQLHSIGTVVILGMSAIGGSMFPRFFMPDWIKPLGLFTINGWAYDGFIDLFRGGGLLGIAAETAVLFAAGLAFAILGSVLLRARLRMPRIS